MLSKSRYFLNVMSGLLMGFLWDKSMENVFSTYSYPIRIGFD